MAAAQEQGAHDQVRQVLREGTRSSDRWVMRFARRGLLRAGDGLALEAALRDLRVAEPFERARIVDDLAAAGAAARPHVSSIVSVSAALEPFDRRVLVPVTLGWIGGPAAGDALAALLEAGQDDVRVLRAIERVGPDARAAAPKLRAMALGHPFWPIRERASRAHESVTGEYVAPGPGTCPVWVQQSSNHWSVVTSKRRFHLWPVDRDESRRRLEAGRCAPWLAQTGAAIARQAGGTCLLGFNDAEWGGGLASEKPIYTLRHRRRPGNALRVLHAPDDRVWFPSEMPDMAFPARLDRLQRSPDGRWKPEPIVWFPGVLEAYRWERQDLLLLVTGWEVGCEESRHLLVRVSPEGRVTAER